MAGKIAEAKAARKGSGIETIWKEDEDARQGIDDANRAVDSGQIKLTYDEGNGYGGGAISPQDDTRGATILLNITAPYVSNMVASLSDKLMPIDAVPFDIEPTPIPFLHEDAKQDGKVVNIDGMNFDAAKLAKSIIDEAEAAAKLAKSELEDQLKETKFNPEVRKLIDDVVAVGVGVLEGPFPTYSKARKITNVDGVPKVETMNIMVPASKRTNYWDFFPAPGCGENIHDGEYCVKRDRTTHKELLALKNMRDNKGLPYYIGSQIDIVLREGEDKKHTKNDTEPKLSDKFTMWYYYGVATKKEIEACGMSCDCPSASVVVVVVNDRVIRVAYNPLPSGRFPFCTMVYERRSDFWAGIGIARKIRDPQRMITAYVRNMLDNSSLGGTPMLVVADGVEMADGSELCLKRGAILRFTPDSQINNPRDAVSIITVPMITNDLIALFQLAQKAAEDVTGQPMLMQGQQGTATETVGGMQQLQSNANEPQRAKKQLFDDNVIVPHIDMYYEWLMEYGRNDKAKGDFKITAHGSTALYERDAANLALLQLMPMAADPGYGINKLKLRDTLAKTRRIDINEISYTEEELKEQANAAAKNPPPSAPAVEVAKIRSQVEKEMLTMKQKQQMEEMALTAATHRSNIELQAREAELNRQHELAMKQFDKEIEVMKLSAASNMSIQEINAQIAQTTQKITAQVALSHADRAAKPLVPPPTEPKGLAQDGKSFEQ